MQADNENEIAVSLMALRIVLEPYGATVERTSGLGHNDSVCIIPHELNS